MRQTQSNDIPDQNSGNSKSRINPFYIEFDEKWTELVKNISDINKEKHHIRANTSWCYVK